MQFEPTAFVKIKFYTCIFIRTTGENWGWCFN